MMMLYFHYIAIYCLLFKIFFLCFYLKISFLDPAFLIIYSLLTAPNVQQNSFSKCWMHILYTPSPILSWTHLTWLLPPSIHGVLFTFTLLNQSITSQASINIHRTALTPSFWNVFPSLGLQDSTPSLSFFDALLGLLLSLLFLSTLKNYRDTC